MKNYSKIKVVLAFLIGLSALYYVFHLSERALNKFVVDTKIAAQEYALSETFSKADSMWKEAEISQKAYLLTAKSRHLIPYNQNKKKIWEQILFLKNSGDQRLTENILKYEQLLKLKFYNMDLAIKKRDLSLEDSLQVMFTGQGREISALLEKKYVEILNDIEAHIADKVAQARESSQKVQAQLQNASFVGILIFIVGMIIIFLDVIKRERYQRELQKARMEALRASHFKSNFLASTSHEIRTPLNSMIGMADLLDQTELNHEQKDLVRTFKRSGESLLKIVNDILDLSKIEAGELSIEKIEFSLDLLLQDLNNIFKLKAKEKNVELIFDNQMGKNIYLQGDPTRIQQVLVNLVGNALKFTHEGSVTVVVKSKSNKVYFSVIDTGIGIPKDRIQEIFSAYQQADSSITRKYGGTGLGLSITKKIIKIMGGNIRATSEVNKGSQFSFYLPLPYKVGPAPDITPATVQDITMNIQDKTILVADDVTENRDLIALFLRKYNPKLVFATNGLEAVNLFKNEHIDLILMDVQMPELNGLEATKQIREIEKIEKRIKIPIVALTAQVFQKEIEVCLNAGCDAHAIKPIKREVLLSLIKKYLEARMKQAA
jgi:signal transduction histidine kinase